jgi:phosphate-selective porin OprO and OprP
MLRAGQASRRTALWGLEIRDVYPALGLLVAGAVVIGVLIPCSGLAQEREATASSPTNSLDAEISRPSELKKQVQVVVETNVPPMGVQTNLAAPKDKSFHWKFAWEGWDGLRLSISQRTPLRSPGQALGLEPKTNTPIMRLDELKMAGNIGARVEVDAAAYRTTGNLDIADDIGLRRALLTAQGDCILVFPVSYKLELGYVPHKFNLNKAYLTSDHIDYIGYLQAGVFTAPMGLDMLTSSRDITFMEPATVLQAFTPGNEAGIQIGQPVLNQRATWSLGIFGGGLVLNEYDNATQDFGNLIGRFTYLAMDHLAPGRPAENRYLHLGLSANVQYSPSSTIRYQSRPESYFAPHVIDTGDIDASGSGVVGAEAAYVNGPFTLQGEFLDAVVRENSGGSLNFPGFYACASWYLTGESRPYNRAAGYFNRLVPRRNFNFGKGGAWGAVEVGARFSYTDLTDGSVHGGRIGLLMGELNWYLHSHVRWMFNAGGGQISGGPYDGHILLFQTRIGVDI